MFYVACLIFGILGAIIGSFSVAQVWRLRAAELSFAEKSGEKINEKEWRRLKNLVGKKAKDDRSHCLNCEYQLRWFDLVPVFSWLSLGGKCRNCRKPIGWLEFIAEISTALIFVVVFVSLGVDFSNDTSPIQVFRILSLFAALSCLVILFVYDAKWSLLPVKIMWIFNFLALIFWVVSVSSGGFSIEEFSNLAISFLIFPAIYFLLSAVSRGAWVGDGDWILAIGLVLLLPNSPVFSILMMFLSNIIGIFMIVLSAFLGKKKISKGAQIPFGPAMIAACLVLLIFQGFFQQVIDFLVV